MAITRQKKESIIAKLDNFLASSNLVVMARYTGLTVADMQDWRREARDSGVQVVVAKNRLVKLALANHESYAGTDTAALAGQLALAIGDDEVAPAQAVANFAKSHPALEIVGGISSDGSVLSADEVKALASLPSKDALRAQLVGTIAAPLSGMVNVLSGNLRGLVNVLNAHAEASK